MQHVTFKNELCDYPFKAKTKKPLNQKSNFVTLEPPTRLSMTLPNIDDFFSSLTEISDKNTFKKLKSIQSSYRHKFKKYDWLNKMKMIGNVSLKNGSFANGSLANGSLANGSLANGSFSNGSLKNSSLKKTITMKGSSTRCVTPKTVTNHVLFILRKIGIDKLFNWKQWKPICNTISRIAKLKIQQKIYNENLIQMGGQNSTIYKLSITIIKFCVALIHSLFFMTSTLKNSRRIVFFRVADYRKHIETVSTSASFLRNFRETESSSDFFGIVTPNNETCSKFRVLARLKEAECEVLAGIYGTMVFFRNNFVVVENM